MAHDQHTAVRHAGRGGLGNLQPAPTSEQQQTDEPRSSSSPPPYEANPVRAPSPSGPLLGGRGGAGNFVEPRDRSPAGSPDADINALAANRLSSQQASGARRMGGRGGAGNWAAPSSPDQHQATATGSSSAESLFDHDEAGHGEGRQSHEGKVHALERKVHEVVDKGLKLPDKVHHGKQDKGHE